MRYHPAVVAQKAATLQILAEGRFTLGLGSGENLNEHVVGDGWPGISDAAGDAARGDRDHPRAAHRRARRPTAASTSTSTRPASGTCPTQAVDLAVAVSGDEGDRGARAAGRPPHRGAAREGARRRLERRVGHRGRCRGPGHRADPDLLGPLRGGRGASAPTSSSAGSAAAGRSTPTCRRPMGFAGASQFVRPEDVAESIPCGPDLDAVVEAVRPWWEAGLHRRRAGAGGRRAPAGVPRRGGRPAAREAPRGIAGLRPEGARVVARAAG